MPSSDETCPSLLNIKWWHFWRKSCHIAWQPCYVKNEVTSKPGDQDQDYLHIDIHCIYSIYIYMLYLSISSPCLWCHVLPFPNNNSSCSGRTWRAGRVTTGSIAAMASWWWKWANQNDVFFRRSFNEKRVVFQKNVFRFQEKIMYTVEWCCISSYNFTLEHQWCFQSRLR